MHSEVKGNRLKKKLGHKHVSANTCLKFANPFCITAHIWFHLLWVVRFVLPQCIYYAIMTNASEACVNTNIAFSPESTWPVHTITLTQEWCMSTACSRKEYYRLWGPHRTCNPTAEISIWSNSRAEKLEITSEWVTVVELWYCPGICLEELRESSLTIVCISAKIRTAHLADTSLERHLLTNLFGSTRKQIQDSEFINSLI
jgi:hypothetical protein